MAKGGAKEKIEAPWFGSFTPADLGAPPPLTVAEPAPELVPEAVPPVPNTWPAGRTYESFLYDQLSQMVSALSGGATFSTTITNPQNNDLLIYDTSSTHWINVTADSLMSGSYLPLVGGTITGSPGKLTVNAPNAATGAILTAQVNGSRRLIVSADSDHILELTDTSNTGPTATLRISHRTSSGTPSTGFGSALQFWGEDTAHTNVEFATIRSEASDNTPAAVSSDLVFLNKVGGTSTEGLRFKGSDGRAIFAGALQSPALHVGDLVTHPATAHISRASGAANPAVPTYLRVKAVADTGMTNAPQDIIFDLTATRQLATGNLGGLNAMTIVAPTWSATAATTITDAATLFVNSAPAPSTNVTITNRYAVYINGTLRIDQAAQPHAFYLNADNTALTGAITGRIPVNFAGVTRYIPVYTS